MNNFNAAILACLLGVSSSCAAEPSPIPDGKNQRYEGNISAGGKFGIRVGMTKIEVEKILLREGLRFDGYLGCVDRAQELIQCQNDDDIAFYRLKKFGRDGQVLITYKQDRVSKISWYFTALPKMVF